MTVKRYSALAERVYSQRELQPNLYGAIDFDQAPYRLTTDLQDQSELPAALGDRATILSDPTIVELISTATMLGDVVADPYAALSSKYGTKQLVGMLRRACADGVDAVPDAPRELRALIAAMEATPAWVDMKLVEEGARYLRVSASFASPFLTRGAFLGTFLNTYAALPMAMTGALSGRRAAHRINETANFFAVTTLPGALSRDGLGFEAAAMVRLMHSMVRFHALTSDEKWDSTVYGIPIPQVDQMPAGLINMYILARGALRRPDSRFDARERAMLEFCRYRCYLLGLPEELLPTTAEAIVTVFHARGALLRADFDDATCGILVRSTMEAYLRTGDSRTERARDAVERSWSKAFFVIGMCNRDRRKAARMGVQLTPADFMRLALTGPFLAARFFAVTAAARRSKLQKYADRYAVRTLRRRLADYGNPEFTTDASSYPQR